jgi:hypothetical protein
MFTSYGVKRLTAIYISRRQEVKNEMWFLNVPSNIQVIHSLKLQTSGGRGEGDCDSTIMQHKIILFILEKWEYFCDNLCCQNTKGTQLYDVKSLRWIDWE